MKPLLSKLFLLFALTLAVSGGASAQWSPPPAMKSVDLPAANSSLIVIGTIVDLKRDEADWSHLDLTIKVRETLKGDETSRIKARVRLYEQPATVDRWKTKAALVLVAFPRNAEEPITAIDLSAKDLAVFTADLKLLRKPEDVIRAVRAQVQRTKDETKVEAYTLSVPGKRFAGTPYEKGEEWSHDGKIRIVVPVDERLERYAQAATRSRDPRERASGIYPLSLFRSDAVVRRLTELLRDPGWESTSEYADNLGYRYRTNQIRRQAYGALQRLGVTVPEPLNIDPKDRDAQVFSVELDNGNVVDADLAALARYPNLESLFLSNARLSEAQYAVVGRLPRLKKLFLEGSNISDVDLASLARLPDLTDLRLENTGVTDVGLTEVARFHSLKRVHLGQAVTDAGVARLRRLRPDLRILRDEFAFFAPLRPRRVELLRQSYRGWVDRRDDPKAPEPRFFALIFPPETADQIHLLAAKALPTLGWYPKPIANVAAAHYVRGRLVPNAPGANPALGKFTVNQPDSDAVFMGPSDNYINWLSNIPLASGERVVVVRLFDDRKR